MFPSEHDTVFFSSISPERFVTRLIPKLRMYWSSLSIDVEVYHPGDHPCEFFPNETCIDRIASIAQAEQHTILTCFRSDEHREILREEGFVFDSSGEGPFEIHLRRRTHIVLELSGVREKDRNVDPYEAILAAPIILGITLVSPGDPKNDVFSRAIKNIVLDAMTFE